MRVSIVAGLSLFLSVPALADDRPIVAPGDALLTVTAEGKSIRTPDIANFNAGITTVGTNASAAMATNAAAMTRVIDALRAAGVADRDVQTSSLSLSPVLDNGIHNDGNRPRITGYQAGNAVAVRSRAISAIGAVIDALVNAGANQVNGPDFAIDHPEIALDEARTAALVSARSRADLYARAAGLKVLRIVSISEGGGYAPQPMMIMARKAMASATPVAAGEVAMSASITVQFELAPQ